MEWTQNIVIIIIITPLRGTSMLCFLQQNTCFSRLCTLHFNYWRLRTMNTLYLAQCSRKHNMVRVLAGSVSNMVRKTFGLIILMAQDVQNHADLCPSNTRIIIYLRCVGFVIVTNSERKYTLSNALLILRRIFNWIIVTNWIDIYLTCYLSIIWVNIFKNLHIF